MDVVTIHKSGTGADKLEVISYGNGAAYNVMFGEAGSPMRNLYFQGDDATQLRDEYDAMEEREPEMLCRDIWLAVLDPYL